MLASYTAYRTFERVETLKGMSRIISKLFGAGER